MSHSLRTRFALGASLLVAASACTRDHYVRGPDGETAHVITCSDPDGCYARAADLCPGGYVIRTTAGSIYVGGVGGAHSKTSLLVSCKADLPGGGPADPPSEDERACAMAYKQAGDFADYYGRLAPHSARLDALPPRRAFVGVCKKLPETVQPCLQDKYREDHAKACDAVVTRLEARDRDRIDGLFFEAVGVGDAGGP